MYKTAPPHPRPGASPDLPAPRPSPLPPPRSTEGALLAAYSAPLHRRILCSASQDDSLLLLGLEDGSVRLWDVRTSGLVGGWERAHNSRVRGMAILQKGTMGLWRGGRAGGPLVAGFGPGGRALESGAWPCRAGLG
jgi:hypothetical protein